MLDSLFTWFKTNPVTACLVFGGILLAGAITVYAIVRKGNWKDRGFMVRNGKELHLPADLPWSIHVEPSVPVFYVDALNTIVADLRDKVGNIFSRVMHLKSAEVALNVKVLVAIDNDISGGDTKHQFNKQTGVILSAFVSIAPGLDYGTALKVLAHEIGHVCGLDHDEHPGSIMHPRIQDRPQSYTEKDIERLRKAYT